VCPAFQHFRADATQHTVLDSKSESRNAPYGGLVFAGLPQVFEALRSQTDLEQLLGSLAAPAPPGTPFTGDVQLPAAWVSGIAAQLRSSASTARCGNR
jgi:hypothetical protein